MFSGSSSSLIPPPPPPPQQPVQPRQPFLYTSPTRPMTFPSHQYPPHQHSVNDYYVGHVLNSSGGSSSGHRPGLNYGGAGVAVDTSSYTCIGAPVGHGFGSGGSSRGTDMVGISSGGVVRDGSLQEEGLNWGRSYSAGTSLSTQQRNLDPSASINRFQDGF